MEDLLYLALVLAAFAAFVGLARICDRIVGVDDADGSAPESRGAAGVTR